MNVRAMVFSFLLVCGALASSPVHSQQILVASPSMSGGYAKTVLVATSAPNGGHIGVILNRPTETTLASAFPDFGPAKHATDPIYFGGPVMYDSLFAIAEVPATKPHAFALTDKLSLVISAEVVDASLEKAPTKVRTYAGIVYWQPGELKAEIEKGLWRSIPVTAAALTDRDHKTLWQRLSSARSI